ncbi:unnamed protein product [Ambrosiozyma monospora]|uniref:Unnamed protein product n=1 Tax=Ambrosiozyma monospora TaxID=43982 RepID=A0ACB5U9L5_AMBMO|nr:unnamed protein product [Ambrosiozyma monospora]
MTPLSLPLPRDAVSTDTVDVTNPAQTIVQTVVESTDLGVTGTVTENVTVTGATVTNVQYVTHVGEPVTVTAAPVTVTAAPTIVQANRAVALDADSTLSTSYTQTESDCCDEEETATAEPDCCDDDESSTSIDNAKREIATDAEGRAHHNFEINGAQVVLSVGVSFLAGFLL